MFKMPPLGPLPLTHIIPFRLLVHPSELTAQCTHKLFGCITALVGLFADAPNFKIKATKHYHNINIRQELLIKCTIARANTTTLLKETDTMIMNLTKIPMELKTQTSPIMDTLTSKEWLSSVTISLLITITPWILLFGYGFCKRAKN